VNRITHERAVAIAKAEKSEVGSPRAQPRRINALTITMTRSVAKTIASSVGQREGDRERRQGEGSRLRSKTMHLAEPIKALGTFSIPVKLLTDVTATLKVEVRQKNSPRSARSDQHLAARRFSLHASASRSCG